MTGREIQEQKSWTEPDCAGTVHRLVVQLLVFVQHDQTTEKQAEVRTPVNWNCDELDFVSRNPPTAEFLLGLEQDFYPSVLARN